MPQSRKMARVWKKYFHGLDTQATRPKGHSGKLQEDSIEEQYRTLLMLNVVLNCIVFWNTLAIQQITDERRSEGYEISQKELSHITPTMTHHIDMIGKFEINLKRSTPFKFVKREVVIRQD